MEKEPHGDKRPNSEDGSDFFEYFGTDTERECPNCGHSMELMIVPGKDGQPETKVFYCWYCGDASDPDDDFEDEESGAEDLEY
ncbi:MAG: hypothetical protein ABI947_22130 [Chloroflexota bacterium]